MFLRVFENRMLRKTFGSKTDEVTAEWRTLHNEELYDLYCSANIIRVNKSRRRRWAGGVARNVHTACWLRNLRERNHLRDLGIDGKIILKSIFRNLVG